MINAKFAAITFATAAMVLAGCAGSTSGSSYSRSQARGEMLVRMGVVEGVRPVQIEGSDSKVGTLAGAAVGGIAGSNVGGGSGQTVGAIVGAVIGGIAGSAIEESATKKNGLEITVKLDNGQLIAVTQDADEGFAVGDKVRVLSGQGATRVAH